MSTTKKTTFNASKFLSAAREAREDAIALFESHKHSLIKTIRDAYRIVMNEDDYMDVEYVLIPDTAEDLRAELVTAAQRAYLDGASKKQIDLIITLAAKKGSFGSFGYSVLTKRQASRLIDDLR